LVLAVAVVPATLWLTWQVYQGGLGAPGHVDALVPIGPWAWCAYLTLVIQTLLLGRMLRSHRAAAVLAALVVMTIATHAVFFGAARYAMVCFPLMAAVAGCAIQVLPRRQGLVSL